MFISLRTLATVLAPCVLVACGPSQVQPNQQPTAEKALPTASAATGLATATATASSVPSTLPANAGENDGDPDITPAPLTAEAAKTETGARAILLSWARGIELREFDQAWNLMGESAREQVPKSQFNALFHPLREITVAVPRGDTEGAAGSIYYTVPTTVSGTRADGSKAVLKGDVILRRVNDVDGATPDQLKWHIAQVNLKPA